MTCFVTGVRIYYQKKDLHRTLQVEGLYRYVPLEQPPTHIKLHIPLLPKGALRVVSIASELHSESPNRILSAASDSEPYEPIL